MEKLTKEEQIAVLDMAIEKIKSRISHFMCTAINFSICDKFYTHFKDCAIECFPDLLDYKPADLKDDKQWFPPQEVERRLEILTKMKNDRINGII
jgi:hypothetical protein